MPNVKLTDFECRKNLLPGVCMFCGRKAVDRKKRTFAWHPPWVWVLILVGILVAAIVAMILTKRMTVRVPVCNEHEGFWRRRNLVVGLSFLAIVVVEVAFIAVATSMPHGQNNDMGGLVCGGGAVLFLGWLVVAAIYSQRGIRPTEITDRFVRLTGVNQKFIDALEDDRERDREEEDEYRRQWKERRRKERELDEQSRRGEREADESERSRPTKSRPIDDDLERRARG
jgi:hypothetical protein